MTKFKRIYLIWLISAVLLITPIIIMSNKNIFIELIIVYLSILLSWSLFNDYHKQTGFFGVLLASLYASVYYHNHTYALLSYELYSVVMFATLLFRNNFEESTKQIIIQIIIVTILAFILYFSLSTKISFNLILIIDLLSFIFCMIATLLSSKRSIYQFLFYIPSSLMLIILSLLIDEKVLLYTSIIFIISDIMSYINWKKNLQN